MLDQIDTPSALAIEIAESLNGWSGGLAFDPTVGNGALLGAVRAVYGPGSTLAGAEIDRARQRALTLREPDWVIGRGDSLNARSRGSNRGWRAARAACEAVVFNPPFSFRGGGGVTVGLGDDEAVVSPALGFILTAAELRPSRGMAGVIPAGALHNRRDASAWDLLLKTFDLEVIRHLPRGAFPGIAATSVLVRLTAREAPGKAASGPPKSAVALARPRAAGCCCVEIFRGKARMIDVDRWGGRDAVLHTTDLTHNEALTRRTQDAMNEGPVVLVPRVGKPDRSKILVLKGAANLSDCLIGVRPSDASFADELAQRIRDEFAGLQRMYLGTGAPHLTIGRMESFARSLGLTPIPSESSGGCSCGAKITAAA